MDLLLDKLNPEQKEAVENFDQHLMILAGAGSGKTRVLTHKMAFGLHNGIFAPHEIWAMTFTNKAAREMLSRTQDLCQEAFINSKSKPQIGTFHSICVRLLRDHIGVLDYPSDFSIYDGSDQLKVVKNVLLQLNLNDKTFPAKKVLSQISQLKLFKEQRKTADAFTLSMFDLYEELMFRAKALDFTDLLIKTKEVLEFAPEIREYYQGQIKLLLIDEFQDTNEVQYSLMSLLRGPETQVCVVGDEDQTIYTWRGANIENLFKFEKDFPNFKLVKLEENYRSTSTIVDAASAVIANNKIRKGKVLRTENPKGSKIQIHELNSEYDEGRFIAEQISQQFLEGYNPTDFAIFYRTNAQSRVLEEELRSRKIPYQIVGGLKFYDRKEIKDVTAYLKLILNPNDDVAFLRTINTPARGIGATTQKKLIAFAQQYKVSLLTATQTFIDSKGANQGTLAKLANYLRIIRSLQKEKTSMPSEAYHAVLDQSGYLQALKTENSLESKDRIQNLEEYDNAIKQFELENDGAQLIHFIEATALLSDIDGYSDTGGQVTLMTFHVSKGLEFPVVFMCGMEEGLFPSQQRLDNDVELEEERRLAYVGMTRAEKLLFMTHARKRRLWGQETSYPPSRFIEEIPEEYVERKSKVLRPSFLSDGYQSNRGTFGNNSSDWDAPSSTGFAKTGFDDSDFNQEDPESLRSGMKVRHPIFGVGSIFQIEGQGDFQKVSVMFKNKTLKKFVSKHARLEVL